MSLRLIGNRKDSTREMLFRRQFGIRVNEPLIIR